MMELAATYSLIIRSRKDTLKENLAQYGQLPIPQWLRVFCENESGTLDLKTAKKCGTSFIMIDLESATSNFTSQAQTKDSNQRIYSRSTNSGELDSDS
jgi:hypothetical protein